MRTDPDDPDAHARGRTALEERLAALGEPDEESLLANEIVELVETDPSVLTVADILEHVNLTERALQRLTHRRLGLSPARLVRRRRLQEASERLRSDHERLGDVAAALGSSDQAHFTRDFRAVTGMTPGKFSRMARG